MITVLKLMNDFIEIKKTKIQNEEQSSNLLNLIDQCQTNLNLSFVNKIEIDPELLELPIDSLLKKVDISDINTFIFITHRFINKKDRDQHVKMFHRGELVEFLINTREQQELLCCKTKRKDEYIKFSFKFIRRELLKKFRLNLGVEADKMQVKHMFNRKYLKNDKKAILYFESFDVSKKGLKVLNPFAKLKTMMQGVQKNGYIEALIKEYIWEKKSFVLEDSFCFVRFMDEILSRQHKHSMVVQGVLNSLNQFDEFFYV